MAVRKRTWTTSRGERKEAWLVDYADQSGERHIQTFSRKKEADEYHATVKVDVRQGLHTAPSKSITVAQAAEDWIKSVALEGREASTLAQYRQHAKHITDRIGVKKLASLTTPGLNTFRDELLTEMSRAMARKVMSSLKSLLRHAQSRGNVAQNVALAVKVKTNSRDKKKPEVGVDIPTTDEIKAIIAAAGRSRPLLLTAIFCRAAFIGAARPTLAGRRFQEGCAPRAPTRRSLRRHRQAEVEGRVPNRAARTAGR